MTIWINPFIILIFLPSLCYLNKLHWCFININLILYFFCFKEYNISFVIMVFLKGRPNYFNIILLNDQDFIFIHLHEYAAKFKCWGVLEFSIWRTFSFRVGLISKMLNRIWWTIILVIKSGVSILCRFICLQSKF